VRANYCAQLTGFVGALATLSETAFLWRSHMNVDKPAGETSNCFAQVSVNVGKIAALIQGYCSYEACEEKYDGSNFKKEVSSRIDRATFGKKLVGGVLQQSSLAEALYGAASESATVGLDSLRNKDSIVLYNRRVNRLDRKLAGLERKIVEERVKAVRAKSQIDKDAAYTAFKQAEEDFEKLQKERKDLIQRNTKVIKKREAQKRDLLVGGDRDKTKMQLEACIEEDCKTDSEAIFDYTMMRDMFDEWEDFKRDVANGKVTPREPTDFGTTDPSGTTTCIEWWLGCNDDSMDKTDEAKQKECKKKIPRKLNIGAECTAIGVYAKELIASNAEYKAAEAKAKAAQEEDDA